MLVPPLITLFRKNFLGIIQIILKAILEFGNHQKNLKIKKTVNFKETFFKIKRSQIPQNSLVNRY